MIPHGYRAAKVADLEALSATAFFHAMCGTRLNVGFFCPKCNRGWLYHELTAKTNEEIADRFYVADKVVHTGAPTMLVWVEEGKKRFSKEVPFDPHSKAERFRP